MERLLWNSIVLWTCCFVSCQRQETGMVEVVHDQTRLVSTAPGYEGWYQDDPQRAATAGPKGAGRERPKSWEERKAVRDVKDRSSVYREDFGSDGE